jgi:hemerythrin-like domain-containing protein
MARLPEAIVTLNDEHRHLGMLLQTLDERLERLDKAGTGDYFLLRDIVRYMHEYPDIAHHPTEDLMFERLVRRNPKMRENVDRLLSDHERLATDTAELLELLRAATEKRTRDAVEKVQAAGARYCTSLSRHMEIEEGQMFPEAVRCLTHADWKSVQRNLEATEDPLFGETVQRDYRVLYEFFSNRANKLSQQLTNAGFLQLDSMIVSADALERGIAEMWHLLRDHGASLLRESRDTAGKTFDGRDLASICSLQTRYAGFLGKTLLDVSVGAAGIGFRTARNVVVPLLKGTP